MTFSLYEATIPSQLQILSSMANLLDKAEAHCTENDIAAAEILGAQLAPDMLPFAFQIKSCSTNHSIGAIESVRKGIFTPDRSPPPQSFAELKAMVNHARTALSALVPEDVNGFVGQDMLFEMGEMKLPFTADGFLLSFAQPNFYFHATTAYAILRMKGVAIGKLDFMGRPRLKQ
jgi:uncharacterized protein